MNNVSREQIISALDLMDNYDSIKLNEIFGRKCFWEYSEIESLPFDDKELIELYLLFFSEKEQIKLSLNLFEKVLDRKEKTGMKSSLIRYLILISRRPHLSEDARLFMKEIWCLFNELYPSGKIISSNNGYSTMKHNAYKILFGERRLKNAINYVLDSKTMTSKELLMFIRDLKY